ncbi:MAG: hypothetical protein IT200_14495 [Thermoleophilia bacterium]|nr:hypothetical protein [Thermoleophilia bacterium]
MRRLSRRTAAAAAVFAAAGLAAGGVVLTGGDGGDPVGVTTSPLAHRAPRLPELPRGGRSVLPEFRVVAHYGAPQAEALGILGIGTPARAAARLRRAAHDYAGARRRPVLPAMELIGVIVTAAPGADGRHRFRQDPAVIRRYLRAARAARALLILDIQPGRSDFVTEARALGRFLIEPDVALALDPEWRMRPGEVPGRVIGQVDAAEVNAVARWLSTLVRKRHLPDKLLLVHQFQDGMIERRARLRRHPGVDMVLNADGFGSAAAKVATYHRVTRARGPFGAGFKLFFVEDSGLMAPAQVMRLRPRPDVVVYE